PSRERRIHKCHSLIARRSRRTQGFYAKEEEKMMVRNDWAADCSREVVAVEGTVRMIGAGQRVLRKHGLVVKIIASQTVELIRTRLCGHGDLKATSVSIFARIRVDLIIRFLNEVGVRDEV